MKDQAEDHFKTSMQVSNHIIDDSILEKVARKAWEKELMQKFKKPFVTKWAMHHGTKMYHFRPEDRLDDDMVTPKNMKMEKPSNPASQA